MAGVKPRTSTANLFDNLDIMRVNDLNIYLIAQVMYQVHISEVIDVFQCLFTTNKNIHSHETRQADHFNIPMYHKNIGKTSIRYRGAVIWNNVLKSGMQLSCSKMMFKQRLKFHISAGSIKDQLYWSSKEEKKNYLPCCLLMKLFYVISFCCFLTTSGANHWLHIYCCTLSAPPCYSKIP